MKYLILVILVSAVLADVIHVPKPNNEYLPPFKPDESPGYKYPEPIVTPPTNFLAFAPTKDIYIPPVRLPLANEVYEPVTNVHPAARPINQSPIVNSANFPPYFQTTSQDLIFPSDPKHPANTATNNNYYAQQTQQFYHPGVPNTNPPQYPPVQYPPSGSVYRPAKQYNQHVLDSQVIGSGKLQPTFGPSVRPDFATPPVATTFPPPTFKPFIFRDPAYGVPTRSPLLTARYP